jgi:hypothetical protein
MPRKKPTPTALNVATSRSDCKSSLREKALIWKLTPECPDRSVDWKYPRFVASGTNCDVLLDIHLRGGNRSLAARAVQLHRRHSPCQIENYLSDTPPLAAGRQRLGSRRVADSSIIIGLESDWQQNSGASVRHADRSGMAARFLAASFLESHSAADPSGTRHSKATGAAKKEALL